MWSNMTNAQNDTNSDSELGRNRYSLTPLILSTGQHVLDDRGRRFLNPLSGVTRKARCVRRFSRGLVGRIRSSALTITRVGREPRRTGGLHAFERAGRTS